MDWPWWEGGRCDPGLVGGLQGGDCVGDGSDSWCVVLARASQEGLIFVTCFEGLALRTALECPGLAELAADQRSCTAF